jgi:predicted nuclease of predicted toxin-antitoxin system
MRILLDECVDISLKENLSSSTVMTVPEMDWRGIKNGELLRKASQEFDVFITSDKNMEYQQNQSTLPLPVIIIATRGNMWQDIEPVIPKIELLLQTELSNEFYAVK